MHLTSTVVTALLLASSTLAQSQSQCVTNCETSNLEVSACEGNETGQALADCTCASFMGPTDPMLVCIKSCPGADVAAFAAGIPDECRGKLFPNVTVASGSGGASASPTRTESSSSATTTSSSAGSMTTGAAATGTTTHATTTTSAAASSSTKSGIAAVNQPAGMVIAIGVLAAFAI
jgi:cobalamin biosynthesis Mg chelatase CobN